MQQRHLRSPLATLLIFFLLTNVFVAFAAAQDPGNAQWIWGHWADALDRPAGEHCYFRKRIELSENVREARFFVTCDNKFELFINGEPAAKGADWMHPKTVNLKTYFKKGDNCIAVEGINESAPAGLLLFGEIQLENGDTVRVESDTTFKTFQQKTDGWNQLKYNDSAAKPAHVIGRFGILPWAAFPFQSEARFETLPGFRVDTVAEGFGSIVAMTLGADGETIYASVENGPIYIIPKDGEPRVFTDFIHGCHGLCYRNGMLYAVGDGPDGSALYEIGIVNNGMSFRCLGKFAGDGGEHGPHGIVTGPDGRLYIAVGNHVQIAQPWSPESPYKIHYEGHPIAKYTDPLGHAVNCKTPGGTIVSVDTAGADWRVHAGGFRNHYDLAFNKSGSLFTYDSDMEWDVGLPWYRPVRLLHIVPGGEYGWRTGSQVWPDYYEDSLPAAVEVGRGSPTGMVFYEKEQFPPAFYNNILACDWSRGEILAFQLEPKGVSFTGSYKTLLRGHPLNVTDIEVDVRGSVLFSTGGRGTRGGIYRLSYDTNLPGRGMSTGSFPNLYPTFNDTTPAAEIAAAANSKDRFLRFAAIHYLESAESNDRWPAISPADPSTFSAAALVALARRNFTKRADAGDFTHTNLGILLAFEKSFGDTTPPLYWKLSLLRALEIDLCHPSAGAPFKAAIAKRILSYFPSGVRELDHELALLIAATSPAGAIEELLVKLQLEPSRSEQIYVAYCLAAVSGTWTAPQKQIFLKWFRESKQWSGGLSFQGYIDHIAADFIKHLTKEELATLTAAITSTAPPPVAVANATFSPKDYDTTLAILQRSRGAARRSPAEGALIYQNLCVKCHTCGQLPGKNLGPDLTTASGRFGTPELLDSIIRPGRIVSDQYQSWDARLKSGPPVTGLRAGETDTEITIASADGTLTKIPKSELEDLSKSPSSLMPQGLLDSLTYEQIGDLLAFIEARGEAAPLANPAWTTVFNGKDLEGFDGDPKLWRVEGGLIAGRASKLPGSSFLKVNKELSNFIVEFDVKLIKGNSGLQFRAKNPPNIPNNRYILIGYQADVGESYWGSLYEEGGRGMLAQVANEIWSSITLRDWNHYVVSAIGDHLTIELNGYKTVDLRDSAAASGYLGFQLHAGGENEVYFRNIRYLELTKK